MKAQNKKLLEMFDALTEIKDLSYPEFRQKSWELFQENGLPTRRNPNWHYTNLGELDKFDLSQSSNTKLGSEDIKEYLVADNYLVFIDGKFNQDLSSYQQQAGLDIKVISADRKACSMKANSIGSLLPPEGEGFVALNGALFTDSLVITVESDAKIKEHYQVLNITTAGFNAPRLFVHAEKASFLRLTETYVSMTDQKVLTCPVSEYEVKENAELDCYKMLLDQSTASHVAYQHASIEKDGKFSNVTFNLSAGLARNNLNAELNGTNAYAAMLGYTLLDNAEHVDNSTLLDHVAPDCNSYEIYKGIYAGKSKGIFNGTIVVQQDAQKTNAIQSNQSLLMSPDAASYSQPQLKIWADDVKCTHGATCGELDSQAMFYLRSRGIPEQQAKAMLAEAFVIEILSNVADPQLKDWVEGRIKNKLTTILG